MKNSILILFMLSLLSCDNDDNSGENVTDNTEIETIINDITSNNNILDGTDVTIEGFLTLNYSKYIVDIECEYPCEDFTCNYETSNNYLVRDSSICLNTDRYEISSIEGNYENAINLSFSNTIDLLNIESDCDGLTLEDYPITISGRLKYGTANNHEVMQEQKSASIIIDENTITLLNNVLTCIDS